MIKRWAEVVVSCGESPRTLLAAAFASIQNIEMAQSLVPAEQVEGEIMNEEGEIWCLLRQINIKVFFLLLLHARKKQQQRKTISKLRKREREKH